METHQNNIEKMTAFIFHEAREKAEEIRIKANEEYNLEKAKIVKQGTEKVELIYQQLLKNVEHEYNHNVGLAKANGKMLYMKRMNNIVDNIMKRVEEIVKNVKTDDELVEQAISNIYDDNVVIYCNDSVKIENGSNKNVKYEVKKLDEKFIGGVMVESMDGRTRVDNTYRARIDKFKMMHLDLIANRLFKTL